MSLIHNHILVFIVSLCYLQKISNDNTSCGRSNLLLLLPLLVHFRSTGLVVVCKNSALNVFRVVNIKLGFMN